MAPAWGVEAQAWLSDRQRTEGQGIRAGDFELHPGIGAEAGYDSNVFLASDNEGEEGSMVGRISPHFYISTRDVDGPPPAIKLRTGVNSKIQHYFATEELGTTFGVGESLNLTINPERQFSAELRQNYQFSQDPFTEAAGPGSSAAGVRQFNFTRNQLKVGPHFQLASPGGLLKGNLGYDFGLDFFNDELFSRNDMFLHRFTGGASWEFLPKTALFWRSDVLLRRYAEEDDFDDVVRNDGETVTSRLGLNGAITPKLSLTLAAGYGAAFYDNRNDTENILAQVEARWRATRTGRLTVAYERQLLPAYQGDYMNLDRFKGHFDLMVGRVFALGVHTELTLVHFGDDAEIAELTGGDGSREDLHFIANLSGEYRFADWLAVTGEVGFLGNFTDFVFPAVDPVTEEVLEGGNEAKYRRFEAWLGLRAFL